MSVSRRMRGLKHQPPWRFFLYNETFKSYEGRGYATKPSAQRDCNQHNQCMGGHYAVHTVADVISGKYAPNTYNRLWIMAEIGARKEYPENPPLDPARLKMLMDWVFPFRRTVLPEKYFCDGPRR